MKKILMSCFILMLACCNIYSQEYSIAEISTIKPSQVIIENYTRINLSKEITDDITANQFDVKNPYTYLQVIMDTRENSYHILLQTNFSGKILFLSYSNNLAATFNKPDKPKFLLTHCLKEINNNISSVQVMNATIKCIVDRLNYCSGD